MKKIMKNLRFSCISLMMMTALTFISCKTSDDTENTENKMYTSKPSISVSGLVDGAKFKPGESINVVLKLSDNVDLQSWKFSITSPSNDNAWGEDFSELITGKEIVLKKYIRISENAKSGDYQVLFQVTNKAKNESSDVLHIEILDKDGYDKNGYDREGFNREGFDKEGYGKDGFNGFGYNRNGYNREGFDKEGYNKNGYNKEGYNKDGFNENGYDKNGYDREGYNKNGYDKDGFDKKGFDKDGFDREGYNKNGYNRQGIHRDWANQES